MSFIYFNSSKNQFDVDDRKIGFASVLSTRWLLHGLLQARPYAHGKLLDIGCGIKPYQALFNADQHVGVDWPGSGHKLNIEAFADAHSLPFADQSFDTVLCTEVIEHLPQPWMSLNEMARVLKPGGHLILSAPFVHVHHEIPHDYYRFTFFGLQSQVRQAGLQPLAIWARGGPISVFVDLASRFTLSISRGLMRKIHTPQKIQHMILYFMITVPQRGAAFLLIDILRQNTHQFDSLTPPTILSLGYVLVASRLGS